MARIYGIKKRLTEYGVGEDQIKEITGGDLTRVIGRMDESLEPEIVRELLDSCGCGGGREYCKQLEKIGRQLKGLSLEEKLRRINELGSGAEIIVLNSDGTLTATMNFPDGERYKCVCSASVKKGVTVADLASEEIAPDGAVMPLSYCFCCAGSFRRHLQLQLGFELATKQIMSSPINSRGEMPCEFIYEIAAQ